MVTVTMISVMVVLVTQIWSHWHTLAPVSDGNNLQLNIYLLIKINIQLVN